MTSEGDAKWALEKIVNELVGGTITGVISTPDTNEFSYGFIVQHGKGDNKVEKRCWIDCDPEGNGPGFIQIEEEDKT